MLGWLRRERQQWINADTGFGWFNDKLISTCGIQEPSSVTAWRRTSKHWFSGKQLQRGTFRGCHGHYQRHWFCNPRFWELIGEGNIQRVAGSILNQAWRTQHITWRTVLKLLSVTDHIFVSSQTMWEHQVMEEEKSVQAQSDGNGPKISRCKLQSEQFWASESFTRVLEPKFTPKYTLLPVHLQIQSTKRTAPNVVLQSPPIPPVFLMVHRESQRDRSCCSLTSRQLSLHPC